MGRLSYGCGERNRENKETEKGTDSKTVCVSLSLSYPVHLHDLEALRDVRCVGGEARATGDEAHE